MHKSAMSEKAQHTIRWLGLRGNTIPFTFRLTLRTMPKEPFPMMSSGSYRSKNDDISLNLSRASDGVLCTIDKLVAGQGFVECVCRCLDDSQTIYSFA